MVFHLLFVLTRPQMSGKFLLTVVLISHLQMLKPPEKEALTDKTVLKVIRATRVIKVIPVQLVRPVKKVQMVYRLKSESIMKQMNGKFL